MALTLYNTASRQAQTFKPLKPGKVSIYTCGPTVYAPAHLGNLRTFVVSDWLKRVLKWNGYETGLAMNITDVDDKTIKASQDAGVTLESLTNQYEARFFADLEQLNVAPPDVTPHATAYIPQMIEMVEQLLARDFAYRTADGIYFRIAKAKGYGALAQLKLDPGTAQSRIKNDQYDKETPSDFTLWKFWQETDGEVSWEAPFGKGRPGWHIECSAMIRAVLGDTIDIHLGGTDLIFPHHTNEIAQSEAVTGRPLANYWLHIAFVNMTGGKMAKSEGNVVILDDLTAQGCSPLAYRYWLLTAHYRTLMNFSWEALEGAAISFKKLQNHLADLKEKSGAIVETGTVIDSYLDQFTAAINDDLNLPVALSVVWQLLDNHSVRPTDILATILKFDEMLGLNLDSIPQTAEIPESVQKLVAAREAARQSGDFAHADTLRQQIEVQGYLVNDTPEGPRLHKT